jgi:hypothetical protein
MERDEDVEYLREAMGRAEFGNVWFKAVNKLFAVYDRAMMEDDKEEQKAEER